MLCLSRKANESIKVGDSIEIVVVRIQGNRVKLSIKAPADTRIVRSEIDDRPVPPRRRAG
jgi:carbon storage regulator